MFTGFHEAVDSATNFTYIVVTRAALCGYFQFCVLSQFNVYFVFTNVGKAAMNHNNSFYVETFYSDMFRLMYKQPLSG
jgi:hypothetical protein